jgi:hypothetical protein
MWGIQKAPEMLLKLWTKGFSHPIIATLLGDDGHTKGTIPIPQTLSLFNSFVPNCNCKCTTLASNVSSHIVVHLVPFFLSSFQLKKPFFNYYYHHIGK